IQGAIGKLMDEYVAHILNERRGIVVESDLSAFLVGKQPHIFSVFLMSEFDRRVERVFIDQRDGGAVALKARDAVLQEEYLKLWNIDIFDKHTIADHYRLVVD